MAGAEGGRLDVGRLLEAVESCPPIEAVDAVGDQLPQLIGARHVSLLIATSAENSGEPPLARLRARGNDGNERREPLPLPGSAYEQIPFSQRTAVVPDGDDWLVLAPVTPTSSNGVSATGRSRSRRRSSAACCRPLTPWRGSVHARRVAGAGQQRGRRQLASPAEQADATNADRRPPPQEVVRELADNALEVTGGDLEDDATALCIDWYGTGGERNAIGGASRDRATDR